MRLIGFNFTKINMEKFKDRGKNLKISTKIDIPEIKTIKPDFFKIKEEIIQIKFSYNINYNPDIAKIELAGDLLLAVESKAVKDILKQWKDKEMSEDFRIDLFNIILRKSSLKALQLEDEMNLPAHISLPFLKKEGQISEKKDK